MLVFCYGMEEQGSDLISLTLSIEDDMFIVWASVATNCDCVTFSTVFKRVNMI